MCAGNAKIETDAAGNRKFTKKKSTGRIDGMVALAMAEGVEAMQTETAPAPMVYAL
jgi:phage terminase large subunit-like protein